MSSHTPAPGTYITISVRPDGVAILTFAKEPVNSFDFDMWDSLDQALTRLEADPKVNAVVLQSGLKRDVFTAGNDLRELYAPNTTKERYAKFWITQNRFLVRLHRSRLATVAAIRGACPAGGCAISLCCDHRLMTPNGSMGLNEVVLGIPVPKYWGMLMGRIIGGKQAEALLLPGRMVDAQAAKQLGLVDELVGAEGLLDRAVGVALQACKVPPHARAATKQSLREDFCSAWEAFYPTEPEFAWGFLSSPTTVKVLGGAMARLSSKPQGQGREGGKPATAPAAKL